MKIFVVVLAALCLFQVCFGQMNNMQLSVDYSWIKAGIDGDNVYTFCTPITYQPSSGNEADLSYTIHVTFNQPITRLSFNWDDQQSHTVANLAHSDTYSAKILDEGLGRLQYQYQFAVENLAFYGQLTTDGQIEQFSLSISAVHGLVLSPATTFCQTFISDGGDHSSSSWGSSSNWGSSSWGGSWGSSSWGSSSWGWSSSWSGSGSGHMFLPGLVIVGLLAIIAVLLFFICIKLYCCGRGRYANKAGSSEAGYTQLQEIKTTDIEHPKEPTPAPAPTATPMYYMMYPGQQTAPSLQ